MAPPQLDHHHTPLPSVFTLSVSVRSVRIAIAVVLSRPMGTGIRWEGCVGVSGSRRAAVLVKSLQGHRRRGIASPLQSSHGDVRAPLLLFHPALFLTPSLSIPSQPPLTLLFLGSKGSRKSGVNKVVPGVGPTEEFPLKSHQQQIVGPTLLSPAGTPSRIWSLLQAMTVHANV